MVWHIIEWNLWEGKFEKGGQGQLGVWQKGSNEKWWNIKVAWFCLYKSIVTGTTHIHCKHARDVTQQQTRKEKGGKENLTTELTLVLLGQSSGSQTKLCKHVEGSLNTTVLVAQKRGPTTKKEKSEQKKPMDGVNGNRKNVENSAKKQ
ncbi:uncharacterized protein EI90DRAFT_3017629 [Cantharellus anzutake]|uniref:uncharacterized protein n=1 Tax=Cantharellus anzutake TaxID=1750568 RepID=UPI001905D104|nr:uncharacterized protein EI90DRAFT_3017629 [Cantharellus anzutake]KAF8328579.1 hypothetical protein EI90DRAFT_3017629 [Cantharellus anzutake]